MARLKVGDVLPVPVEREHIDKSAPCNKDSCMLSEGFVDHLTEKFGADKNYKVKTTNHAACHVQTHRCLGVPNLSDSSARTRGLIKQFDERRR